MKHIIFTRFMYDDTEHAQERIQIMNNTLIKCLKNQTNQNFTWALMCRPYHHDSIRSLYGKEVLFFNGSLKFKEYVTENKFTIQTRHDSDDLMCPEYIQIIQDEYNSNKFRKDPFLIHFQPTINKYDTDSFYEFHIDYEKNNLTSAFITLCPQNTTKTIWDHSHTAWVGNVPTIIRNKNNRCVSATIHGLNTSTRLSHKDKLII